MARKKKLEAGLEGLFSTPKKVAHRQKQATPASESAPAEEPEAVLTEVEEPPDIAAVEEPEAVSPEVKEIGRAHV